MHATSTADEAELGTFFVAPALRTAETKLPLRNNDREQVTDQRQSIDIPGDLREYLTTTSHTSEVYSSLRQSRERRLRLLLRRFTNQIQYGCKNVNCDVPSCLSFRKRNTKVPLRQYTDIAARALAWRCLEEYASAGKAKDVREGYGKRKTKVKPTSVDRPDGLCRNEPVVPWYQDPSTCTRQRIRQVEKHAQEQRFPPKQHFKALNERDVGVPRVGRMNGWSHSPSSSLQEACAANASVATPSPKTVPERHTRSSGGEAPSAVNGAAVAPKAITFVETDDLGCQLATEQPKDTASFTQVLYDTRAIKHFDELDKIDTFTKVATPSDRDLCSQNEQDEQGFPVLTDPIREKPYGTAPSSVHTFRLLNKRVMSWLVTRVSQRPHDIVNLGLPTEQQPMSITELAQQSLHYCLAHPLRLLASAEKWRRNKHGQESSKTRPTAVGHDRAVEETDGDTTTQNSTPQTKFAIPDLDDAIMALDVLSCIQSYPDILNHIFAALQHAYSLPPCLSRKHSAIKVRSTTLPAPLSNGTPVADDSANSNQQTPFPGFLDDGTVANICMIALISMINSSIRCCSILETAPDGDLQAESYINYLWCREIGQAFPHAYMHASFNPTGDPRWRSKLQAVLLRLDAREDMHLLRLLDSFTDVIAHRLALHETLKARKENTTRIQKQPNIIDLLIDHIHRINEPEPSNIRQTMWALIDLMCVVLLKRWDKTAVIQRTSPVGGALSILAGLYRNRVALDIPAHMFNFKFVAEAFDPVTMPLDWLAFREDHRQTHILSFSFLFDTANLVKYFRAININIMRKAHEYAMINHADAKHFLVHRNITVYGAKEVLAALRPHMARYFVLTIRRNSMLEDGINQIWRRERQELIRPLKISLGKNEGEDGLDHGGVQQEFFRVVFGAALNPDYGMFTTDDRTRMTWFQPDSPEPLYKFEAIGVLMSLAVYNAVTLPVTFPLAFYRKILGLKVKSLQHIEDGWPDLVKGLRILQDWKNGDVGDTIMRTYEFVYKAIDTVISVDMSRIKRNESWPPLQRRKFRDKPKTTTFHTTVSEQSVSDGSLSVDESKVGMSTLSAVPELEIPKTDKIERSEGTASTTPAALPPEAPLVTNANRNQYIKDYVFWLTNKSIAPQFEAFLKGFHACLDPTALSIFTPEALKTVIEGYIEIDIDGLQATTTYDDFNTTDQTIVDFWDVVRNMSPSQHKHLLEFVTASDRVPVSGIASVTFIIQKNGEEDERLPSSSTCYGRLLLPKYSSKEILKTKLEKAIENSVGFGSL